jgi:hypothetical protein
MTNSEIWARRRERLAKFKREGLTLTANSDHCKWHHWHAKWCPACVTIKQQLRDEQAAATPRHNVDLRPALAKCARFP